VAVGRSTRLVFQLDLGDLTLLRPLAQPTENRLQQLDPEKQGDCDQREDDGRGKVAQADHGAQCREDPDDCSRGDPNDSALPGEDHPTTKEADTSDDLGKNASRVYPVTFERGAEADEQLRAKADEDARSNSRRLAAELPLQPNDAAAQNSCTQAIPEGRGIRVERIEHGGAG
jgi:hypothetical protein